MLQSLHMENIAVMERADLEFGPGLNVLTGETGAGKSIVIDAMGAVLGGRASRELIRTGAERAAVSAVFTGVEQVNPWLEENGIPPEEDGLFLARQITSQGKTTCRVNGVPLSASQLRTLGGLLLHIHGQNDGMRLLDEKNHLAYLDSFGRTGDDLAAYRAAYDRYRAVCRELDALEMDEGERARRMDTLEFQIDELSRAQIQPGELEEKTARRDLLRNGEKYLSALETAYQALYGGHSGGAVALLEEAERAVAAVSRYGETLASLESALTDLRYGAEDLAQQLRDLRDEADFSPGELEELEGRLDQLRRLSRKYGGSEEEMLSYLEACTRELDALSTSGDRLKKLEAERDSRLRDAQAAGEALSQRRREAGKTLAARIQQELAQLSMAGVRFEVSLQPAELSATGCDRVAFLLSANAGEAPGRISRIASGGELARIMLAMTNVLTDGDPVGAMVFDEIDTGVSGIAAQRVGEKLAQLARAKQVICVTHLPQIAVLADTHFEIVKTQSGGRTYTQVHPLDEPGREREIARLTGGENITPLTLQSAAEQLAAAAAFKAALP